MAVFIQFKPPRVVKKPQNPNWELQVGPRNVPRSNLQLLVGPVKVRRPNLSRAVGPVNAPRPNSEFLVGAVNAPRLNWEFPVEAGNVPRLDSQLSGKPAGLGASSVRQYASSSQVAWQVPVASVF